MNKFIERIKALPKGTLRLLIVVSIIIPITGLIFYLNFKNIFFQYVFFYGFITFWLLVRIILWIYDGYNEDANK